MASWKGRLVLVDGFAGPGIYEDGQPGSPIIMLNAYLQHASRDSIDCEIVYLFIEQEAERATVLKGELAKLGKLPKNVKVDVINDTFENAFGEILDDIEGRDAKLAPTFAFLDPFGYSDAPMTLTGRFLRFRGLRSPDLCSTQGGKPVAASRGPGRRDVDALRHGRVVQGGGDRGWA